MSNKKVLLYKDKMAPLTHRELDDNFELLGAKADGTFSGDFAIVLEGMKSEDYVNLSNGAGHAKLEGPCPLYDSDGSAMYPIEGEIGIKFDPSTGRKSFVLLPNDEDMALSPNGQIIASAGGSRIVISFLEDEKFGEFSLPAGFTSQTYCWWKDDETLYVAGHRYTDILVLKVDLTKDSLLVLDSTMSDMLPVNKRGVVLSGDYACSYDYSNNSIVTVHISTGTKAVLPEESISATAEFFAISLIGMKDNKSMFIGIEYNMNEAGDNLDIGSLAVVGIALDVNGSFTKMYDMDMSVLESAMLLSDDNEFVLQRHVVQGKEFYKPTYQEFFTGIYIPNEDRCLGINTLSQEIAVKKGK